MSEERPVHIAALDAALFKAAHRVNETEAAVAAFMDYHLDAILGQHKVLSDRSQAYSDVRLVESSIRKLGYIVIDEKGGGVSANSSIIGDKTYSTLVDEKEAIARRAR